MIWIRIIKINLQNLCKTIKTKVNKFNIFIIK